MMSARCLVCPIPEDLTCRGTAVRRFCELVDPGHPAYQPGYIQVLRQYAGRPLDEPPPSELAESRALLRSMKACEFRSTDLNSGCGCGHCALRGAAIVSHLECFACIRTYSGKESLP